MKRQLAEKIADNTLELALKGHVRKPFMMVGRVGDSCVSILEKKGRISMQIDGVEQPTGETSPLIISDENITQQLDKQPIMENIENGEDPSDSSGKFGEISNDRIADTAVDGAGEMQGGPLGLDGENQCERGLPPVFGAAPAGGTLELLALEGMLKALEARPRGRKALEMKENSLSSHLEKLLDRKMLQNGKRQARKKEEKLSGTHLEKLLDQAQRPCRRGRPPKNESRGQSLPSAEISQ